jgi:hypothetical protein
MRSSVLEILRTAARSPALVAGRRSARQPWFDLPMVLIGAQGILITKQRSSAAFGPHGLEESNLKVQMYGCGGSEHGS